MPTSLFPPAWTVTWGKGRCCRAEFAGEKVARTGLLALSVVLPPGVLLRLRNPAGRVVETMRWKEAEKATVEATCPA